MLRKNSTACDVDAKSAHPSGSFDIYFRCNSRLASQLSSDMGNSRKKGRPGRPKKRKYHRNIKSKQPLQREWDEIAAESTDKFEFAEAAGDDDDDDVLFEAEHGEQYGRGNWPSGARQDEPLHSSCSGDGSSSSDSEDEPGMTGFRLVDLECLEELLSEFCCCGACHGPITLTEVCREGLASCLELSCGACEAASSKFMSRKFNRAWEVTRRAVLGMRLIGRGLQAMAKMCGVLNMPSPMSKSTYYSHSASLQTGSEVVAKTSMNKAAREARGENADDIVDVAVSYDGTWMRRGYASLHGVFTAISWDVGKVVDYEVLSRHCHKCTYMKSQRDQGSLTEEQYQQKMAGHVCDANTVVSAPAMESEAAKTIWARSVDCRRLRYTTYIGDGDTKSYKSVCDSSPYGADVTITKEECVGHVQKRVGSNLRKMKKNLAGKKLADGKPIGGRGRLTDAAIEKLQNYYGFAVRNHSNDLQGMARAIWASLMHCASTDDKPQHQFCPPGQDSWCKWQQQQAGGNKYTHHDPLPEAVWKEIKPIYIRLSERSLLEKCLRGSTQNRNECFNGLIWQMCPKTTFASASTVNTATALAVAHFNDGAGSVGSLLEQMGLPIGQHTARLLELLDLDRSYHAARKRSNQGRKSRKRRRRLRKGFNDLREEEEGVMYEPGGF